MYEAVGYVPGRPGVLDDSERLGVTPERTNRIDRDRWIAPEEEERGCFGGLDGPIGGLDVPIEFANRIVSLTSSRIGWFARAGASSLAYTSVTSSKAVSCIRCGVGLQCSMASVAWFVEDDGIVRTY